MTPRLQAPERLASHLLAKSAGSRNKMGPPEDINKMKRNFILPIMCGSRGRLRGAMI